MCSVAKAKRETYEKYFYEVELTNEKTSVNWHPRIRHCARKQWKCCCLAASFRLKQTWKRKNLFFISCHEKCLSLVVFFIISLFYSFRKPREKMLCTSIRLIDAMVSDLHCLSFLCALKKIHVTRKRLFGKNNWKKSVRKRFDVDQNVICNRKNWNDIKIVFWQTVVEHLH